MNRVTTTCLAAMGFVCWSAPAFAQTYKLVETKPYPFDSPEITWTVDTKKDPTPWKIRYKKGANDIVLSWKHADWNPMTKQVEIELSIGPVNEGAVRIELVDRASMTLIGQLGASTPAGSLGAKTLKVPARRKDAKKDPETFTLGLIFDDGKKGRQSVVDYTFKLQPGAP